MKAVAYILLVQGIYWLLTGVWGLVDIESFMKVTGPKTDVWLVKTVSVLIVVISLSLLSSVRGRGDKMPVILLAITSCIGLAGIDFYYALNSVISRVYLLDGVVQVLLVVAWVIIPLSNKKKISNRRAY
jgi:hypothetical protein